MGIYFRDILLISISRGANNCGQHALEKNIYFIMRFSPHSQLFCFNDRLEFCEFFEWKIKRINNADLFSQTPFLTFIKGANISGGHCMHTYICTQDSIHTLNTRNISSSILFWTDQALSIDVLYIMWVRIIWFWWRANFCTFNTNSFGTSYPFGISFRTSVFYYILDWRDCILIDS